MPKRKVRLSTFCGIGSQNSCSHGGVTAPLKIIRRTLRARVQCKESIYFTEVVTRSDLVWRSTRNLAAS
ncbi:hypothetical protein T4B_5158 [Trichinella pseudospiralis]|uniref:Uncharacterized protein n=1 Tax=Trichinella pseudospiralis TaxID=6337 RepID=A0A0V1F172_TRIPS|nr:hypothetical protein T4A_3859 [Trichinella pseudospiralis]KRZ33897.1 hypothetical protein T4B_5158 [Trichinella pseudospiralis]KRZ42692.1 hypothetical protein T4C_5474 [Trichinella pseudospiralis]